MNRLQLRGDAVYLDGVQVYPTQLTLHMDTEGARVHLVLPVEVDANLPAIEARVIPSHEGEPRHE